MKKIIYLGILIFITIQVVSTNVKNGVKENKVYSRKVDLSYDVEVPNTLDIDNKVLTEKSKEILEAFYPDDDFEKYKSELYMPYFKYIYVNFFEDDIIAYQIGYKVSDGSISYLNKYKSAKIQKNTDYSNLIALRDEGVEYLRRLRVLNYKEYILNNEVIDSYSYYAYYRNVLLNKDLTIHIDPKTYELIYFSIYDYQED